MSVANLTRQDGLDFLRGAPEFGIVTKTTTYPLAEANRALADLRAGRFEDAAGSHARTIPMNSTAPMKRLN